MWLFFFIAGIVLAAIISTRAFQEAYRSRMIQKQVDDLKAQALQVQNENQALTQQIAYLQTPEFQEKIAKEKLNMQEPDENVVVVTPGPEQQQQAPEAPSAVSQTQTDVPNYTKWWNLFFKY